MKKPVRRVDPLQRWRRTAESAILGESWSMPKRRNEISGISAVVNAVHRMLRRFPRPFPTRDAEIAHELRAFGPTPIAELEAGTVAKICGRTRSLGKPLEAPLTGRRCVWFWVTIEKKYNGRWSAIIDEERGVNFLMRDASGKAKVAIEHAETLLTRDLSGTGGISRRMPARVNALLQEHGLGNPWAIRDLFSPLNLRYKEYALEVDASVAVLGSVRFESMRRAAIAGYRGRRKRVILEGIQGHNLLISNVPSTFG